MSKLIWLMLIAVLFSVLMVLSGYWLSKKIRQRPALAIWSLTLLAVLIAYQVWDNNRIVVKQQIVYVAGLPDEFDGFGILQITDLHGKRFGSSQENLTALINSLDYDLIAVTGDMESASGNFSATIALLDGIQPKGDILYINGNLDWVYDSLTGRPNPAGEDLAAHRCQLLTGIYAVERGGHRLWLVNDLYHLFTWINVYKTELPENFFRDNDRYQAYREHFAALAEMSSRLNDQGDIIIGLSHIPYNQLDFAQEQLPFNFFAYDLVLAGHYHGGQIRIPWWGALYIPIQTSYVSGWFPDQGEVSGMMEYEGITQYVSRGLGASTIPFRLFNPPEINLIVLKVK